LVVLLYDVALPTSTQRAQADTHDTGAREAKTEDALRAEAVAGGFHRRRRGRRCRSGDRGRRRCSRLTDDDPLAPVPLALLEHEGLRDRGLALDGEREGVRARVDAEHLALQPVGERLTVHRDANGDEVPAVPVARVEEDRGLGALDLVEPLGAVVAHELGARGVAAREELRAGRGELPVAPQGLRMRVRLHALGHVGPRVVRQGAEHCCLHGERRKQGERSGRAPRHKHSVLNTRLPWASK
jgi:hypothetical protein